MPMSKSVPIILMSGTRFYGRTIVDGTVWQFNSTFLDKKLLPLPVWIIDYPSDLKKIQLRSFVRIDTALPVKIDVLPEAEGGETVSLTASTKDISGGGMQLALRKSLPLGTKIAVAFELPNMGEITTEGTVVRIEKSADCIFTAGIRFIDIPERERDKIIKFIFRKQCERRQKGI